MFREKVWREIAKIPRGRVATYKSIAEKLGTKAYRAVGTACNMNPHAPKIPCHRVVNSDGSIGGYAHGKSKKIKLLRGEGVKITNSRIINFEDVLY